MNTLVIVLSAILGQAGEEVSNPTWQRDYAQAQKQAAQAQKPLAVFLAPGQDGLDMLVQGGLAPKAKEIMGGKYICVIIDTATPEGKQLASKFEISGTGLVLSDRSGDYQAFWHQGTLSSQDLVRTLQKFAGQTTNIRFTETAGRTSFYPSEGGAADGLSGYCPSCSSCAGGNCRRR
jgi:hypothetical protein